MDDYPGQTPAPQNPPAPSYPPPAYQPPAPQAPQPGYAPQPDYAPSGYAPQPGYPAAPPKKKKTWLWIVIALVVVGLLGCCGVGAFFLLMNDSSGPTDSIDAINQAALDGDTAAFEKYFDADSVTAAAYEDFVEYVKGTSDYTDLVTEVGEEEADRLLREEILPQDLFIEEMQAEFSIDSLEAGDVPFPDYTVSATNITDGTAELSIVVVEEGEDVTYVLGLEQETIDGEQIWRVKEIKNIAEMLEEELDTTS